MSGERGGVYSIFGSFTDIRDQVYLEEATFTGFFHEYQGSINGVVFDLGGYRVPSALIRGIFVHDKSLEFEKKYFDKIPPGPITYKLTPVTNGLWVGSYSLKQPDGKLLTSEVSCQLTKVEYPLSNKIFLSRLTQQGGYW